MFYSRVDLNISTRWIKKISDTFEDLLVFFCLSHKILTETVPPWETFMVIPSGWSLTNCLSSTFFVVVAVAVVGVVVNKKFEMILSSRDTNDNSFRTDYAWHGYCWWNILDNNNKKRKRIEHLRWEREKNVSLFKSLNTFLWIQRDVRSNI